MSVAYSTCLTTRTAIVSRVITIRPKVHHHLGLHMHRHKPVSRQSTNKYIEARALIREMTHSIQVGRDKRGHMVRGPIGWGVMRTCNRKSCSWVLHIRYCRIGLQRMPLAGTNIKEHFQRRPVVRSRTIHSSTALRPRTIRRRLRALRRVFPLHQDISPITQLRISPPVPHIRPRTKPVNSASPCHKASLHLLNHTFPVSLSHPHRSVHQSTHTAIE